jgi:alpha-1,3-glucan synthase
MFALVWLSAIALFSSPTFVHGLKYTLSEVDYNLNANKTATNPADYWVTERTNHTYNPSPDNWRFPFYTIVLDRFVNGDPSNDNANKTLFETDMMSTQIRNGGDLAGLVESLDYIAGMGIKVRQYMPMPSIVFAIICSLDAIHVLTKLLGYLYGRLAIHQSAMGR